MIGEEKKPRRTDRGFCEGCQTHKTIWARGICERCWRNPDIRCLFKSRREKERKVSADQRNKILTDVETVNPKILYKIAHKISRKFHYRVDPEDLVQIAWVVLLKSVDRWVETQNKTDRAKSLLHYCKRGMLSQMFNYAQRTTDMGLVESFDRVSDTFHGLRGGLCSRDYQSFLYGRSVSNELAITPHAMKRYRERVNPTGIAQDVRNRVRNGRVADQWVIDYLSKMKRNHATMFVQNEEVIFCIVADRVCGGINRPTVLSVMLINSILQRYTKPTRGRELAQGSARFVARDLTHEPTYPLVTTSTEGNAVSR